MTPSTWYVVETQRHRERVAGAFLAQRSIPTYLPMVELWPRPAVGSAVAPMFPGYLFVRPAEAAESHLILRANGVKGFVCFGGEPAPVSPEAVEFLRSRETLDGVIHYGDPTGEGCVVRIVQGPFRGLTAVVSERLPARERVRVLMEILQRQTTVELPERWVRQS
jgi:transcription antitermination factor NusG